MWSVAAPRVAQMRRDPAPTRMAYRYNRMMLQPFTRRLLTRWLPVLGVLALGVAVATTPTNRARIDQVWADLRQQVVDRPEFAVQALAIEGASVPVSEEIRDLLELSFPTSRLEMDLAELRSAIQEIPAVADVRLSLVSGGVLQVLVDERQPVAVWRSPEGLALVDAQGVQVAWIDHRAARADLPLIAGSGAAYAVPEAEALIAALGPLRPRFRGLVRRGERRWDVMLDRDQRIMLPAQGARAALERVAALAEASDVLERDFVALDMRVPRRPTARLSAQAHDVLRVARGAAPEGE